MFFLTWWIYKHVIAAILKDSDFHEIDRAECQFTTTATVLDNGTQVRQTLDDFSFFQLFIIVIIDYCIKLHILLFPQTAFEPVKDGGTKGFFESIEEWWHAFWEGMVDFITEKVVGYRVICPSVYAKHF